MELKLFRKDQPDETGVVGPALIAPIVGDDYWSYAVPVSEGQAVVGFPKFGVIGIGFQVEEDWNTNLPSSCEAERIFAHIKHNKGDDSIADEDVLAAIKLIQAAVEASS